MSQDYIQFTASTIGCLISLGFLAMYIFQFIYVIYIHNTSEVNNDLLKILSSEQHVTRQQLHSLSNNYNIIQHLLKDLFNNCNITKM